MVDEHSFLSNMQRAPVVYLFSEHFTDIPLKIWNPLQIMT